MADNAIVLFALFALVWLATISAKTRFGKPLGAALLVIIFGAIAANLSIIPSASNSIELYSVIFKYVAPLAIFYLVLGVNLKKIRQAGFPLLWLFIIGSIGTVIGVLTAYFILDVKPLEPFSAPIAGMVAGTYSGGSVNFNAVALHYQVNEQGMLYAGTVAADNVLTTVWMLVTIALPKLMQKLWQGKTLNQSVSEQTIEVTDNRLSLSSLASLLFIGGVVFWLSGLIASSVSFLPMILVVTTVGLVLAQIPYFHKLAGAHTLGLYAVYLFLVVIGAYCEVAAIHELGAIGLILLAFMAITVFVHGLITIIIGRVTVGDWKMIAIASQANIGGGTTAMALAETFDRRELIVPAILIGSLGNAIGTYLGFATVTFLG